MLASFSVGTLIRGGGENSLHWYATGISETNPSVNVNGKSRIDQPLHLDFRVAFKARLAHITSISIIFPPYWTESRVVYLSPPTSNWPDMLSEQGGPNTDKRSFTIEIPTPPQQMDNEYLNPVLSVVYEYASVGVGSYYPVEAMDEVPIEVGLSLKTMASFGWKWIRAAVVGLPSLLLLLISELAYLLFKRIDKIRSQCPPDELKSGPIMLLIFNGVACLFGFLIGCFNPSLF